MNILAATLYDPPIAGSASTASLLAMTAVDTTNLRHTFTVPAHGKVFVRLVCTNQGGSGVMIALLGILDGATVKARVLPKQTVTNVGGVAWFHLSAEFTISGLTPGSVTWDAAYGVEQALASSAIKFGGPNNTTGVDAFGGFLFEVWDPQPVPTAAPGAVNGLLTAPATANVGLADIRAVNNVTVTGTGVVGDEWGP